MTKKYTTEQEQDIKSAYVAMPTTETVDALATKYDVPRRSIITKLSQLNVYKAKRYLTKQGDLPRKKAEMVRDLEGLFKDFELEQLEKLSKPLIAKLTLMLKNNVNTTSSIAE